MITIKEFYGDVKDIDESVLAVKSDCLWEKGSLLDIKNLVTPQLFHLHILVNLIGNWRYEGWWFIMCEMVQFVPYIAETLSQAGAEDMKTAFEKVIDCFPGDTRFEDSEEYFDIVNIIEEDRDRLLKDFSHGMKNKMQMLVQLIAEPDILLLDEPLTSLDVVVADEMKKLLKGIKQNHILIFSTHIMELAVDLCDEIVILNNGKLSLITQEDLDDAAFQEKIIRVLKDGDHV